MKKAKLMILLIFMFGVLTVSSCTQTIQLSIPTDVQLDGSTLTWVGDENALKYRLQIVNDDTEEVLIRIVENGVDLNSLFIPEGNYHISIQAVGDGTRKIDSTYSESISYYQDDINKVSEIEGTQMLNSNYIKWMGRTNYNEVTNLNWMYYSASGFEVAFQGTTVNATLYTNYDFDYKRPYLVIVIDDDFDNARTVSLTQSITNLQLVNFEADDGLDHKVALYKRSESIDSHVGLKQLTTDGKFLTDVEVKNRKIEVIAASSSTGFGDLASSANDPKTTANSDALRAYAFLTARALDAEINIVSASGWGVKFSRWTSPQTLNMFDAYKKVDVFSDVDWDHSSYEPDVIVTNLGTNDWSYISLGEDQVEKDARMEEFIVQYVDFLNYLHEIHPNATIIVLYGLMGETYIYDQTLEIVERASVDIPNIYVLKGTSANPTDGYGSNYHPSVVTHQKVADELIAKIREVMNWSD